MGTGRTGTASSTPSRARNSPRKSWTRRGRRIAPRTPTSMRRSRSRLSPASGRTPRTTWTRPPVRSGTSSVGAGSRARGTSQYPRISPRRSRGGRSRSTRRSARSGAAPNRRSGSLHPLEAGLDLRPFLEVYLLRDFSRRELRLEFLQRSLELLPEAVSEFPRCLLEELDEFLTALCHPIDDSRTPRG